MTREFIEQRKGEILEILKAGECDIEALEAEDRNLDEQLKEVEKRETIIKNIEQNKIDPTEKKEERKMNEEVYTPETQEYRSLWLKKMQGTLTDAEKRTGEIALTNAAGVVPTLTQELIFTKIVELAPIINEITLLRANGNVRFAVEGVNNAAALHTENALITPAADTMLYVDLGAYEIVKLIRISAAVRSMSINAFEGWITDQLAEAIARKIEEYLIVGTGSSQPKGLDKANTWTDKSNGIDWASTAPTAAEIISLAALLKGGYARNAKWVMNWTTFLNDVYALRDDSKYPLVQEVGGKYYILNRPVLFSDYAPVGEIYFGDLKKVVANLSADIVVSMSADSGFAYNAIDFRGACTFDSDIALGEAFVKGEATLA